MPMNSAGKTVIWMAIPVWVSISGIIVLEMVRSEIYIEVSPHFLDETREMIPNFSVIDIIYNDVGINGHVGNHAVE